MKIGIDLDEVIAEFVEELLNFYNKKSGKNHTKDEFKEYAFWKAWGITKEECTELIDEFHETHKIESIKPVKNAVKSISRLLHEGDELFIITARPIRFKKKVEDWVKHHLKTTKIKVLHGGDFHPGQAANKAQICKELGIKVMIEDAGSIAMECANEGIKVILFNKPWNQNYLNKNITRVNDWLEALKILKTFNNL